MVDGNYGDCLLTISETLKDWKDERFQNWKVGEKIDYRSDEFCRYVRKVFDYDQETGCLHWAVKFNKYMKVGKIAGNPKKGGAAVVGLKGYVFPLRQLIWVWHYGEWPNGRVFVKDGDEFNFRIENLEIRRRKYERTKEKKPPKPPKGPGYSRFEDIPRIVVEEYFMLDENGNVRWRKSPAKKIRAGSIAGVKSGDYYFITFKGVVVKDSNLRFWLTPDLKGKFSETS